jgi:subtilisin family serine protease
MRVAVACVAPTQGSDVNGVLVPGIITAQGGASSSACRDDFGGTSSSTPLVAGVVALVLEANPALTARDVQYILRSTATKIDPSSPSWITNGAGIAHSRLYGFGRVNSAAAVNAALARSSSFTGEQVTWDSTVISPGTALSVGATATSTIDASASNVQYLENAQVSYGH